MKEYHHYIMNFIHISQLRRSKCACQIPLFQSTSYEFYLSLEMSLSLIKVLLVPEFEWCFVDWVWFLWILLVLSTMWGLVTPISWYYVYHAVLLRLASLISCFEFYDFPPRSNCREFSNSIIIQVGGLYIVYN